MSPAWSCPHAKPGMILLCPLLPLAGWVTPDLHFNWLTTLTLWLGVLQETNGGQQIPNSKSEREEERVGRNEPAILRDTEPLDGVRDKARGTGA